MTLRRGANSFPVFVCISVLLLKFSSGSHPFVAKFEPGGNDETTEEAGSSTKEVTTEEQRKNDQKLSEKILDVAYYLRRFKFNGCDPRPSTDGEENIKGSFVMEFPTPPLRSIHWEVKKNCDSSFVDCIEYLQEHVSQAVLPRQLDSLTLMQQNGWSLTDNAEEIKRADTECLALLAEDEKSFGQFSGPVQKFQWLTSASYYTCLYTLKQIGHLKFFAEDCDNFASCIPWDLGPNNRDVRSDNAQPFACALYSFCPDPCCPLKHIQNLSDCFDVSPCSGSTGPNRTCTLPMDSNLNLASLILNRWNISCSCDGVGMRWDSKSGLCVDIDECIESEKACNLHSETCKNLPGSYKCICNPIGYQNNPKTNVCEHDPFMHEVFHPSPSFHGTESQTFSDKVTSALETLKSIFLNPGVLMQKNGTFLNEPSTSN